MAPDSCLELKLQLPKIASLELEENLEIISQLSLLTDEEKETHRGWVICSKSPSKLVAHPA